MSKNSGKRDILIFPKFNNIDKIQEIRNKYDKLANLIPLHITLAFPFFDKISNEELIDKLSYLLKNFFPFDIIFSGLSLSDDNYIFLNCIKGRENLIYLHDEIYKKILSSHFNDSITYVPHITLGQASSIDELNGFNYTFSTFVDEISIELIGENDESIIIKNIELWKNF